MRRFYIRSIEDKEPSWWFSNKTFLLNFIIRTITVFVVGWGVAVLSDIYIKGIAIELFK